MKRLTVYVRDELAAELERTPARTGCEICEGPARYYNTLAAVFSESCMRTFEALHRGRKYGWLKGRGGTRAA